MQHHNYSLTELENMMPWEREIYLGLLEQHIKEENEKREKERQKMDKETESVNKYQKWIDMARAVDQWRIFPRIFITTYIYLLYAVVMWYMELSTPSMEQSGLVSIVVGAGAAWFGLYTGSSKK